MKTHLGILSFLVAAGSLLRTIPSGFSEPTPPQHDSTSAAVGLARIACDPSASDEGPLRAVRQVFGSRATASSQSCSSWECVPPHSTEFIIASLADPEQTDLSLNFDRELEALMWAVEDSGYAFEARWLPWTNSLNKLSTFADRECLKAQKEERRKQPGLLIFRAIDSPGKYLFVWLTGETPTSGIDPAMFTHAITYSRIIDPDLLRFRLLGPSFSGARHSFSR